MSTAGTMVAFTSLPAYQGFLLIAATALRYQATLVTRNVREFSRVQGLQWLNWHEVA